MRCDKNTQFFIKTKTKLVCRSAYFMTCKRKNFNNSKSHIDIVMIWKSISWIQCCTFSRRPCLIGKSKPLVTFDGHQMHFMPLNNLCNLPHATYRWKLRAHSRHTWMMMMMCNHFVLPRFYLCGIDDIYG